MGNKFTHCWTQGYFNWILVFVPIKTQGLKLDSLVSEKQGDTPSVLLNLSLGEIMLMSVFLTSEIHTGQYYQVAI